MRKIDIMIVGAQKAGTTSLKNYLVEHPNVVSHHSMEFAFFNSDKEWESGYKKMFNRYYEGIDVKDDQLVLAKHAGLYESEKYISRLHNHNPKCQIIFLVRHPVDRAFSSYQMERRAGYIDYPFSELAEVSKQYLQDDISDPRFRIFFGLGMYAKSLEIFLKYFQPDQLSVFTFEEFTNSPLNICKTIFKKVRIDTAFQPDVNKKYNEAKKLKSNQYAKILLWLKKEENPIKRLIRACVPYRFFLKMSNKIERVNYDYSKGEPEVIDPVTRKTLLDFYEPFNAELKKITGLDLTGWAK